MRLFHNGLRQFQASGHPSLAQKTLAIQGQVKTPFGWDSSYVCDSLKFLKRIVPPSLVNLYKVTHLFGVIYIILPKFQTSR
jgi:hypothetical protein